MGMVISTSAICDVGGVYQGFRPRLDGVLSIDVKMHDTTGRLKKKSRTNAMHIEIS